jgi:hypothetical protein
MVSSLMHPAGLISWLTTGMACLLFSCSALASAHSFHYQKENKDWEDNRKKLNSDFTVQEFEYRKRVPELSPNTQLTVKSKPEGDHQVALSQSWELMEGVDLQHQMQMGMSRDKPLHNPQDFRHAALEETLTQAHSSRLSLQPTHWSTVVISNRLQFKKREHSLSESQRRDTSARGVIKMSKQLKVEPYFQQTQEKRYDDRQSLKDTVGVDLNYGLSRYTTLQPKISSATQYDNLGRAAMRDRVFLGVTQVLYRKFLSLNVSPEYIRQTRDWDSDYFQESYAINNVLTWTPVRHLTIKNGSKLLQEDFDHNQESHWRQRIYSEISHRPIQNMNVRMLGEYDISEKDREVDHFRDTTSRVNVAAEVSHQPIKDIALKVRGSYQQEVRERYHNDTEESKSRMAFAFRPEYRISDAFTTGAEYRYQYRDQGSAASNLPEEEQIFMVNIVGTF